MSIQRILVVDDDPLSREFLVEAVKELGFQASEAQNGVEALARVKADLPDLILTDLRMPDVDGLELVRSLKKEAPDLPTVLVTAHGTIEAAVEAMRLGAADFILKPCSPDAIEMVIDRIQRTAKLMRENEYLRAEIVGSAPPNIIAKSPAMLEMLRSSARIARSKGTVLITGESGTGKERVAH
jgi:two-component system response regulator AtoC